MKFYMIMKVRNISHKILIYQYDEKIIFIFHCIYFYYRLFYECRLCDWRISGITHREHSFITKSTAWAALGLPGWIFIFKGGNLIESFEETTGWLNPHRRRRPLTTSVNLNHYELTKLLKDQKMKTKRA